MKKLILLFITIIGLSAMANAQAASSQKKMQMKNGVMIVDSKSDVV